MTFGVSGEGTRRTMRPALSTPEATRAVPSPELPVGKIVAAALRADLDATHGMGTPAFWNMQECGSCGVYVRSLRDHECPEPARAVVFCTGPKGHSPCGRVRLQGRDCWDFYPTAKTEGLPGGLCATCYAVQLTEQHQRWAKEGRDLLRQRKQGFGPAPDGVDVFAGFREEE